MSLSPPRRQVSSMSNTSSTYSSQTQQSSTSHQSTASHQSSASHQSATSQASQSSVIVNKSSEPPDIQSSVLQYIQGENEFDANEIFQQRQFITNFDKDIPKKKTSIFFDDDFEYKDDEYDDDDDDDDIPPSPPRSPPREIDPDKLYGLYDFSGPDPSHCSLSRDEPVYLINDQDNYWWLIRKLSKQERIQLTRERILNNSEEFLSDDDDYMMSDEEDGKIGFVPAECLETYGERLARLNCFKNEELEKSSKDLIESSNPSSSDNVLGLPVNFQKTPDTTILRSGSILRDGTKLQINKSVTFEDLGVLELNEDSENDIEEEFPSHYNIPEIEEIHNEIHAQDDDKRSEILSDVYPVEAPLIINKRKLSSPETPQSDYQTPIMQSYEFNERSSHSPESPESQNFKTPKEAESPEEVSVDKESPEEVSSNYQTPKETHDNYDYSDYTDEYFDDKEVIRTPNSERLRRSEILNRLNQVTSDIQNELDEFGYEDFNYELAYDKNHEPSDIEVGRGYGKEEAEEDFAPGFRNNSVFSNFDTSSQEEDNQKTRSNSDHVVTFDSGVASIHSVNSFSNSGPSVRMMSPGFLSSTVVSPNVSVNSSPVHNKETTSPKDERRKSKPVHDMFVPILGKFDELAEKLAEIDEML